MPKGCFLIAMKKNSEFEILGYFFKDQKRQTPISDDLLLRIRIDHNSKEINKITLENQIILSFLYKFHPKFQKYLQGIIVGLFLNIDEDAKSYISSLQTSAKLLEELDYSNIKSLNIEEKIEHIYVNYIEKLKDIVDSDNLKKLIIERTKTLLSGNIEDRKLAQELLGKIEDGIHIEMHKITNSAEEAIKNHEYEKAAKKYNAASKMAVEIYEDKLAKTLEEKAINTRQLPNIIKEREEVAVKARNSLKNDDFHTAYSLYRKAADLSEKLMDFEKSEEYSLKSRALSEFHKIDKKYKHND